jgi:hypothetical protein
MTQDLDDAQLAARLARHADAGMRRVTLDVSGEQVALFLRQGRLRALCTCGLDGCDHLATALGFLGERVSVVPEARARTSLRTPPPPAGPDHVALGQAFEELCLAVTRAGTSSPESPSIREALDQLLARVGTPAPLGLARWVARLQDALASGDPTFVARLLDGTRELASELVRGDRSPAALARRRVWLGTADGAADSLTDATLVEVGRERLNGLTRASIERRYLLDVASGEAFKEERRAADQEVSVGPCPRVVHVAFAELDAGSLPRRVRLLQYTVSIAPSAELWMRIGEHAAHSVRELGIRYAEGARSAPGQAEQFVLFAPREVPSAAGGRLIDDTGDSLPLADDTDATAQVMQAASAGGEVVWVAGRLLGLARGLALRPTSLLVRRGEGVHLCRIT